MEFVIGVVCLVVGAVVAYVIVAGMSNSRLKTANSQLEDAKSEANRIASEAERLAETAKKETVLEAKEEILQLKQNSEAEEKKRKIELQNLENRIMVGHSEKNQTVHFAVPEGVDPASLVGRICEVRVDEARTWYLRGTMLVGIGADVLVDGSLPLAELCRGHDRHRRRPLRHRGEDGLPDHRRRRQ